MPYNRLWYGPMLMVDPARDDVAPASPDEGLSLFADPDCWCLFCTRPEVYFGVVVSKSKDQERIEEVRANFKRQGIIHGMDATWCLEFIERVLKEKA